MALALSSGELTKKCEDLSFKLSVSEQETIRKNLELKDKDNNLSQQEQKIKDYELLLRQNDENLANCQRIINTKSDQIEQLERKQSDLIQLSAQTQTKIVQLEDSLLPSQTRIKELETQIQQLTASNPNSQELSRLKAELTSLRSFSSKEIASLKSQLQQAKLKEQVLLQKIQALTSKKAKEISTETTTNNSA